MKWKSIRTKLIIFLLLATVIPIIATMFITYTYTTASLKTRVATENANLLYQGGRNLTNLLDDLNRSSSNVYSVLHLLQGGYEDSQSSARVYAVLYSIASSLPDVFQIYLYENVSRKATLVMLNTPQRQYNTEPYETVLQTGPSVWVQPSHMSTLYGFTNSVIRYPDRPVFTLHRRIENVPSSDVIGYLAIDVEMAALSDIADQLYVQGREKIYLISEDGQLIYSDEADRLGETLEEAWYTERLAASETAAGHFEHDGSVYVYQTIQDRSTSWTLVKQIPLSYLTREASRAAGLNLLLLAVSLMIIAAATVIISIRITAPIKRLARYMNQIQAGKLDVDIQPSSNDEIGSLTVRFRGMMDTINNLILREYKLELAGKTNQLRAMQAQINPHFLNNTLQIIGTLALELKVPQVYALLASLAKMMRYSMHNEDRIVTLREEMEHIQAYIDLQMERFESRFHFSYDGDDSVWDVTMPKMILQPILENYFKHGYKSTEKNGQIRITARAGEGGGAVVTVENNGLSIPEERLARLQEELAQIASDTWQPAVDPGLSLGSLGTLEGDDASTRATDAQAPERLSPSQSPGAEGSSSIGLANVLERLKLFKGDEADMKVENVLPQGVRITVHIPAGKEPPVQG
ncbi:sensor histidine kinase [Paenibacillus sp. 1P07SE]|uniref:sensor histidine kinase n=1 Tax=Paenibacillus sp. 1P07SE TaxID=3132209 RepID=UPI0039A49D54